MTKPSIESLLVEIERTDDRATYSVLADALVEAGDPRGELVQTQLALDDCDPSDDWPAPTPRTFAHRAAWLDERVGRGAVRDGDTLKQLRQRERELLGLRKSELLGPFAGSGITLDYRYGFLDRIRLVHQGKLPVVAGAEAVSIAAVLARVMASPEARMLRTVELDLRLGWNNGNALTDLVAAVGSSGVVPPSSLRALVLGETWSRSGYTYSPGADESTLDMANVLDLWPLHELWVDLEEVRPSWSPLISNQLRHLTYVSPYVRGDEIETLARSELPQLESFVLWTGAYHYVNEKSDMTDDADIDGCLDAEQLEPWFELLDRCPAIRTVGVANHAGDVTKLVEALARHACAARIETLDLTLADAIDAEAVAPQLDRFPALRTVVVEGVKKVSRAQLAGAQKREVLGNYPTGEQRYRYVVHQE